MRLVGESRLVRVLEDITDADLERQERLDEKLQGDGLLVIKFNLLTGLLNGGNGGLFAKAFSSIGFRKFSMSFESLGLSTSNLPIRDSSKVCELSSGTGDIELVEYVIGTDGILTELPQSLLLHPMNHKRTYIIISSTSLSHVKNFIFFLFLFFFVKRCLLFLIAFHDIGKIFEGDFLVANREVERDLQWEGEQPREEISRNTVHRSNCIVAIGSVARWWSRGSIGTRT